MDDKRRLRAYITDNTVAAEWIREYESIKDKLDRYQDFLSEKDLNDLGFDLEHFESFSNNILESEVFIDDLKFYISDVLTLLAQLDEYEIKEDPDTKDLITAGYRIVLKDLRDLDDTYL